MAVTVSVTKVTKFDAELQVLLVAATYDSSYPTGGENIDLSAYGKNIKAAVPCGPTATGFVPEAVNGGASTTGIFVGRMFYGDNNNASDGPLIEVPNATNLNGVVARFLVFMRNLG